MRSWGPLLGSWLGTTMVLIASLLSSPYFSPCWQLEVTDSNSRDALGIVFLVGLTCWVLLFGPPHSYPLLAPASSFFFIFDYTFPSKTKVSLNTTSDSELQARTSLNMVQEVKSVSILWPWQLLSYLRNIYAWSWWARQSWSEGWPCCKEQLGA